MALEKRMFTRRDTLALGAGGLAFLLGCGSTNSRIPIVSAPIEEVQGIMSASSEQIMYNPHSFSWSKHDPNLAAFILQEMRADREGPFLMLMTETNRGIENNLFGFDDDKNVGEKRDLRYDLCLNTTQYQWLDNGRLAFSDGARLWVSAMPKKDGKRIDKAELQSSHSDYHPSIYGLPAVNNPDFSRIQITPGGKIYDKTRGKIFTIPSVPRKVMNNIDSFAHQSVRTDDEEGLESIKVDPDLPFACGFSGPYQKKAICHAVKQTDEGIWTEQEGIRDIEKYSFQYQIGIVKAAGNHYFVYKDQEGNSDAAVVKLVELGSMGNDFSSELSFPIPWDVNPKKASDGNIYFIDGGTLYRLNLEGEKEVTPVKKFSALDVDGVRVGDFDILHNKLGVVYSINNGTERGIRTYVSKL